MCEFALYSFNCPGDHYQITKARWCHFARVRDGHPCSRVKELKRVWPQSRPCPDCDPDWEARLTRKEYTHYTHTLNDMHLKMLQQLGTGEYNAVPGYRPSYVVIREKLIREKGVQFVERYHPYKPPPKSERRRGGRKSLREEEEEQERLLQEEIQRKLMEEMMEEETGEPYGEGNCAEDAAGQEQGQVQDQPSGSSQQRGLFSYTQPSSSSQQQGLFFSQPAQGYGQQSQAGGYSDNYAQHDQGYSQQPGQDFDQQYEAAYGGSYQAHGHGYAQHPGGDNTMDMEYEQYGEQYAEGEGQSGQTHEGHYPQEPPSRSGSGRAGKQPR